MGANVNAHSSLVKGKNAEISIFRLSGVLDHKLQYFSTIAGMFLALSMISVPNRAMKAVIYRQVIGPSILGQQVCRESKRETGVEIARRPPGMQEHLRCATVFGQASAPE
jgi:hypothetical protein